MSKYRLVASECGVHLDSHVVTGGGSDDTQALQRLLDRAQEWGQLTLVLDGAALISAPLKLYSNTTLECPDTSCGLFLQDGSNCCMLRNAHFDLEQIHDENIRILGGSFNHNAPGQLHDVPPTEQNSICGGWVIGMEFYGVKNMVVRDVTMLNQRTFTMLFSNWAHVTMENIYIDLREHVDAQNQDGLHFWGPGRFLTLRGIRGSSGDDFIALAPDENDFTSSIEDVVIDGVQLEGADQGIRLLSRAAGRLDRVLIKNVTGTYKSYGFIVNPWFDGEGGNYGNIVFDTVDLRPLPNNYDYAPPFLFKLGGNIEQLTLRNLYHHRPSQAHRLIECGGKYMVDQPESPETPTHIERLVIDGLYVSEDDPAGIEGAYLRNQSHVDEVVMRGVYFTRSEALSRAGSLIRNEAGGSIGALRLSDIHVQGLDSLVEAPAGSISRRSENNVTLE